MEDLYFNLSTEEFSKGRKILVWVVACLSTAVAFWDLYLELVKHDSNTTFGLTATLLLISAFLITIAILSTSKRKSHFFKVDSETISFQYGLIFPSHRTFRWDDIERIFLPPHKKDAILEFKDGNTYEINLTWIEKNKSRLIRRHIYYTAMNKKIEVLKKEKRK